MTVPERPQSGTSESKLIRIALWVAIGALIVAALVCVVWVLVGSDNDIVGRAFLTILLLAAFAGIALLDARLAPKRPAWFALASMVSWVARAADRRGPHLDAVDRVRYYYDSGYGRFVSFLLIVLILQLALLHSRLLVKAHLRHVTGFTRAVTIITIAIVLILTVLLVLPLMTWEFVTYSDPYWRAVVALAILGAVGTALIPLVNALFAPEARAGGRPAPEPAAVAHVRRRRDPAPGHAGRLAGLERLLHGLSVDGLAGDHADRAARARRASRPRAVRQRRMGPPARQPAGATAPTHHLTGPTRPAATDAPHSAPGYEGYPPPPPLPPRP